MCMEKLCGWSIEETGKKEMRWGTVDTDESM